MERKQLIALFAVALLSLACLEGRLFYLQVIEHDHYKEIVRRRRHVEVIQPSRGPIKDRNDVILVRDERAFSLEIVQVDAEEDPNVTARLARLMDIPEEEIERRIARNISRMKVLAGRRPRREYKAIMRRESRTPYPLMEHLAFDHAYTIEVNPDYFPGLIVRAGLRRVYLHGSTVGHLTGYIGPISEKEHEALRKTRRWLARFDSVIGSAGVGGLWHRGAFKEWTLGRSGIEAQYDEILRGRAGLTLWEKRRRREPIELELLPVEAGREVRLTVDLRIQEAAVEALGGYRGAVVVMDIRDGSILAMASTPTYDPNVFIAPRDNEMIRAYFRDRERKPLRNRAIHTAYPPGSVFKVFTALAALKEGGADPARTVTCTGIFSGRYRTFRCWIYEHGLGHGTLDLVGGLERSCNVYFYTLGSELGTPPIATWAYRSGFGSKSGIDLLGERRGTVPRRGVGDYAAAVAIGQDKLLVTPLQVARAMAFIANGGRLVRPRISFRQEPRIDRNPLLPDSILAPIRKGMIEAVEGRAGTARLTGLRTFKVAGKTGSAQIGGNRTTHAWFGGYFPHDAPRYAFAVIAEQAGHGGAVAAPIAETVIRAVAEHAP